MWQTKFWNLKKTPYLCDVKWSFVSLGPDDSHLAKRAFPLSSFKPKSPISNRKDERQDASRVYVSYACGLRRCLSIYGVGIFVSFISEMVFGDTRFKMIGQIPTFFLCNYTRQVEPCGGWSGNWKKWKRIMHC